MNPKVKEYIKARMKEPSTWRGLIYILTALGIPIAPNVADALEVLAVGLATAGGLGVVTPDKKE